MLIPGMSFLCLDGMYEDVEKDMNKWVLLSPLPQAYEHITP